MSEPSVARDGNYYETELIAILLVPGQAESVFKRVAEGIAAPLPKYSRLTLDA